MSPLKNESGDNVLKHQKLAWRGGLLIYHTVRLEPGDFPSIVLLYYMIVFVVYCAKDRFFAFSIVRIFSESAAELWLS